jgi:carotenoid cleavage dioxygenase
MDAPVKINPYLAGNFAPVLTEDDFSLRIEGNLPEGLSGVFYRNGANPQFTPREPYHWFGGDGMVHAVFLQDGQARYRNRYVRTPKWRDEHAAGKALFGSLGNPATTDPSVKGRDGGVANTHILSHAGRLMALEEGHMPTCLDPLTLETLGYAGDYRDRVTAHPKIDPETGEMVWFGYAVGTAPFSRTLSYGVTDASGRVTRRDDFEAPYCAMAHDFLVTRRHALFPILPLTGSLERAMAGGPPFAWEGDKCGYVGVMERSASVDTVRWFEIETCYVFHPMNAWEEGSKIIADVMEYPEAPLFPRADGTSTTRAAARLVRWTLDLAAPTQQVRREPLDDLAGEFPRIDDRRAGLTYRHGWYAANSRRPGDLRFNALAHVDHGRGRTQVYMLSDGDAAGEPVFIPKHGDAEEGEGWIVSFIFRGAEDRSDFAIFDAQNLEAGPVALARLPRRVPFGFHGSWRPL